MPTDNQFTQLMHSIVSRIVQVAQPEQIVMFGSRARGDSNPNSDVDLLVIKKGNIHRRMTAQKIYNSLADIDMAVDVVVVTTDDVERYRDRVGTIVAPALAEGQVVYDAHV